MSWQSDTTMEVKRIWIQSLILDCPMGEPSPTCPMSPFRELNIDDRTNKVTALSDKEVNDFIAHHKECSERRAELTPNPTKNTNNFL